MPIMKRATRQIQETYPTIEIRKGIWGYYAIDTRYSRQRGTPVRDKTTQVLRDILERGKLPQEIEPPQEE